jgi:DNA-binding CsgD family transcriptional regulator
MGLIGRQQSLAELLGAVTSHTAPLVVVSGPPGIGRSRVLSELRDTLDQRGIRAFTTRFYRNDHALATDLAPHTEIQPDQDDLVPGGPPSTATLGPTPWPLLRSVVGAHSSPAIARRAATMITEFLREQDCTVLILDDAQWMDLDLIAVAEALVHRFIDTPFTCVCALQHPVPAALAPAVREMSERLHADRLVHEVYLRPLSSQHIAAVTGEMIQAQPDATLVNRLQQLSRGVPAALLAAIDAYQQADSIRVVDRHAFLVRPRRLASLSLRHDFLAPIGRLGDIGWATAKAVAVLHPLGPAVPTLVSTALGISEQESHILLEQLRSAGVLRFQPGDGIYQFRVPLVADTLVKRCGPYERRQLAHLAVSALSSGRATCADPNYITDQLANAGRLLDPEYTVEELLTRARAIVLEDGERADEWLQAAADLATDRERRAQILFTQATARFVNNDYHGSLACSTALLADYAEHLSNDTLQETQVLHVRSLHSVGDIDALERIVSGERLPSSNERPEVFTMGIALSMLGRWRDAYDLLYATRNDWLSHAVSAGLGSLQLGTAALFVGYPREFEQNLSTLDEDPLHDTEWYRYERASTLMRGLLAMGDHNRAEKLLISEDLPVEAMRPVDQAWLAALRGQADRALDLHRASVANDMLLGSDQAGVASHPAIATILYARGRLTQVREMLRATRATRPVLPHLLDAPEAWVDRALGDPDRAERRLHQGIATAAEQGVVLDTDVLWFQLAEIAVARGDLAWGHVHLTEIDRVAAQTDSSRARLHQLLASALVKRDEEAARQAVRLAKERGQPLETARVIERVVRYGLGDPSLLPQAYELFGDLDALLFRSWMRDLMRQHNITVPGRQTTLTENERLLAVLVSQGLGNKELATVLQATEKSIEGRLSRLFSRAGYRSRVELAAAILNGEYPDVGPGGLRIDAKATRG